METAVAHVAGLATTRRNPPLGPASIDLRVSDGRSNDDSLADMDGVDNLWVPVRTG